MWKPDPISATGAADTIQETGNRGDQQLTHKYYTQTHTYTHTERRSHGCSTRERGTFYPHSENEAEKQKLLIHQQPAFLQVLSQPHTLKVAPPIMRPNTGSHVCGPTGEAGRDKISEYKSVGSILPRTVCRYWK